MPTGEQSRWGRAGSPVSTPKAQPKRGFAASPRVISGGILVAPKGKTEGKNAIWLLFTTRQSKDLNAKLRALGFQVFDPEVSVFTMGGGGVHCMAQPLRRDPAGKL